MTNGGMDDFSRQTRRDTWDFLHGPLLRGFCVKPAERRMLVCAVWFLGRRSERIGVNVNGGHHGEREQTSEPRHRHPRPCSFLAVSKRSSTTERWARDFILTLVSYGASGEEREIGKLPADQKSASRKRR